ncbi:MAG: AAA family ATPase [Bacteroidales bacterium]|nr:AAA family ATPase [Bacteroidales bacterium]
MIGRKQEITLLEQAYHSNQSEFIAIYGRRRVGKTFLVRQIFSGKFAFTYSGMPNVSTKIQLHNFYKELKAQGYKAQSAPQNWTDAFFMLREFVASKPKGKKVIFLDELPWMDGRQSSFLPAFENFWNAWASARKDILLIVCGSATSWIVKKILHNRGGLHNRLTNQICLQPFNLKECEEYVKDMDLPLNRQQIVESYMIFGGIPFYWSLLEKSKSLSQNIDNLFFGRNAKLKDEFQELYNSLFAKPEVYIEIIKALGTKKAGMTREEIIYAAKLDSGGKFTSYLEDLENCGFIRRYQSPGSKTKNALYQLVDNFTLFYFKFMEGKRNTDANYWSKIQMSSVFHTWSGLAFERICLLHSEQIKKALGISGVITNEYSWRTAATEEHPGAQIDLLIDRSDKTINLCEIKYSDGPYTIDKKYMENLRNKAALFRQLTKTRKGIALTMITGFGLVKNSYSMNNIHSQLTVDDLFANA